MGGCQYGISPAEKYGDFPDATAVSRPYGRGASSQTTNQEEIQCSSTEFFVATAGRTAAGPGGRRRSARPEVGDKPGSGVRWIRSYVARRGERRGRHVLRLRRRQPGGDPRARRGRRPARATRSSRSPTPSSSAPTRCRRRTEPRAGAAGGRAGRRPARPRLTHHGARGPRSSAARTSSPGSREALERARDGQRLAAAALRRGRRRQEPPRRRGAAAPAPPSCAARRAHGATAPTGRSSPRCARELRADPRRRSTSCGPLRPHLALLLPELGEPAAESDRATIFEAVRCAFAHLARGAAADRRPRRPAVVGRGDARAAARRSPRRCASCRCS